MTPARRKETAEQPELHAVAHTHWDREWYHSQSRFQQRLVALIDAVIEQADTARPFLLDGQAILLRDYLATRPEQHNRLAALLRLGALEAGPWYVLADNLIPSGEAIVRNLQAGRRTLARFDAAPPAVAYCPDTFGHPAAMPLIAAGFGLESAVVWRGLGGDGHPAGDTVLWTSPDGSMVATWHLPRDGYEAGSSLPATSDEAEQRWTQLRRELIERMQSGVAMLPCGADHHALQPDLDDALDRLRRAAAANGDNVSITRSTLAQFGTAARLRAHNAPQVTGELRNSYGYTWTLQGTLATRAADKRRNARIERLLLHDVEPWCALAVLRASNVENNRTGHVGVNQLRALLAHAWETLLETHSHDTLCGCSVDDVARAMQQRQRSAAAQALGLRQDALSLTLGHDVVAARARRLTRIDGFPLVVRNRSARVRSGVASIRLHETIGDVTAGPGSAAASQPRVPATLHEYRAPHMQTLSSRARYLRRESPQHYPDQDLVIERRALTWVNEVEGHGLLVVGDPADFTDAPDVVSVSERDGFVTLGNRNLRVVANERTCELHVGNRRIAPLMRIGYTRDMGDSYTPSLRGDTIWMHPHSVGPRLQGALRGSVRIAWRLPGKLGKRIRVVTDIELDAGAQFVRVRVRGVNRARNQRLRLHIGTDVDSPTAYADAAFGPVVRTPISVSADAARMETPVPTMPLHRWLCASNSSKSVTVVSDGLTEAEVRDNDIAITIVRAIGELSRGDLPERPGNAGWPASIPLAQSRGRFAANLGVLLHNGWSRDTVDAIERTADDCLLPLLGESWRDLEWADTTTAGMSLTGAGLRLQALMPDQGGEGIIVRIVNLWDTPGGGVLHVRDSNLQVAVCRLDEELQSEWRPMSNEYPITVAARAALSLRIRRAQ